jgi:hypothetical protein
MSKNTGFKTEAGKDIHVDDLLFSAVLRKVGRVLEYRSTYIVAFFQKGQGIKYFDIETVGSNAVLCQLRLPYR